jgi:hypothetical protein
MGSGFLVVASAAAILALVPWAGVAVAQTEAPPSPSIEDVVDGFSAGGDTASQAGDPVDGEEPAESALAPHSDLSEDEVPDPLSGQVATSADEESEVTAGSEEGTVRSASSVLPPTTDDRVEVGGVASDAQPAGPALAVSLAPVGTCFLMGSCEIEILVENTGGVPLR